MLQVQVQYLNYLESKRHNQVVEAQEGEVIDIQRYSAETGRMAANEQARHNRESEVLGFQTLEETSRHNLAMESETYRHNVQSEDIGMLQAQASLTSASAAVTNAAANASRAALEQEKWQTYGQKTAQYESDAARSKALQEADKAVQESIRTENERKWSEWEKIGNIIDRIVPF